MKQLPLIAFAALTLFASMACTPQGQSPVLVDALPVEVAPAETPAAQDENQPARVAGARPTAASLEDQEITDLIYMHEEEKLAHDVYQYLYQRWGLNIFQNIAASEQTHMDALQALLAAYGLEDTSRNLAFGHFNNADLQGLYDQLTAQGSLTLSDALKTGAAIEEIDILDLQEAITRTRQANILLVYENLLQGSSNHLRSFIGVLQQQSGETYQPQTLSQEDYQAILAGMPSNGVGNGSQGLGRGGSPNRP